MKAQVTFVSPEWEMVHTSRREIYNKTKRKAEEMKCLFNNCK